MDIDPALVILRLVPMILSLSFHEFAHAWSARRLGDDTAERAGRLTLNPMAHIDVVGTLVLPIIGALTGLPSFGWAKPVPVNPSRFRRDVNMRRGYALVSAAGPLSNLLLAVVCAAALGAARLAGGIPHGAEVLLSTMVITNVGLCVFNFLPIPPLDGSKVLPRKLDPAMARLEPYSSWILMGVMMVRPVAMILIATPTLFLVGVLQWIFRFQLVLSP